MVLRRRGFIKYIFLIPTFWLGAIILFSLRTDSSPKLENNEQIRIHDDRRDETTAASLVGRFFGAFQFQQHPDADHPVEEIVKAKEQAKEMKGQVQVAAPDQKNEHNNPKIGGPGEMGNPVKIDKEKLSKDERKKYDDGWKNNAFNQYVSDMISLRRTLADIRDPE